MLARKKRNKSAKFLHCLIVLLMFSNTASPTTVIVVARDGRVYLGADGKRSGTGRNGHTAYSACKIQRFGDFLVAHYGGYLVQAKVTGSDEFKTLLNTDKVTRDAMRAPGSVSERAGTLEATFIKAYKYAISNVPSNISADSQEKLRNELRSVAFVVVGPDTRGVPTAIVLFFSADFTGLVPRSAEKKVVLTDKQNRCLGLCDFATEVVADPFSSDIEGTILTYLKSAASMHPDLVGPPYVLARVSKGAIKFVERGACAR